ncbi:four helix bundle protein [Patescibacteria group bacterium]|nr:four helix bundle protein [Patescibacteria group bacterium]MDE1946860.1 four helix bundle protein [Patescibacteria group bacterium]MDE2010680.1 four helix bundle protein [Patescibacteria group bacterium]MDE2232714.1 four helix bundle protein [Patescibacteria group bacterium]
MALYYTLPIYKSSYKLAFLLFDASTHFAREYKYTVGQQLKDEAMKLVKNVYRANKAIDKNCAINEARENAEMIRLMVRLMKDFNQLSLKKFLEINLCIEDVSKQLTSWGKSFRTKLSIPPESSVARAQTSVRSKFNGPLASSGKEYRPDHGCVSPSRTHGEGATNTEAIITVAGYRDNSSGSLNNQGGNGNYWSSSVSGTNAFNLNFNSSGVNPSNTNNRANGFSVRCIKHLQIAYEKVN